MKIKSAYSKPTEQYLTVRFKYAVVPLFGILADFNTILNSIIFIYFEI